MGIYTDTSDPDRARPTCAPNAAGPWPVRWSARAKGLECPIVLCSVGPRLLRAEAE
jgi:hypothetical protein